MKIINFMILTLLFSACSPTTKPRVIDNSTSSPVNSSVANPDGPGVVDDGTGTTDPNSSNDPGFANCDLSPKYFSQNLGYFGVCQNTVEMSKFKIKFQKAESVNPNCIVPMHKQDDGKSFSLYTGVNIDCIQSTVKDTNYIITIRKNQLINQQLAINSLMVMKLSARNAFYDCMYAKSMYINSNSCQKVYQNGQWVPTATCISNANANAALVCNNFASQNADFYKAVHF